VRCELVLCAVLGGCGFQSAPARGGSSDGGTDSAIDGVGSDGDSGVAPGCFPHWLDHSVSIDATTVEEIGELVTTTDDRNPWISEDGLRLYFSRAPGEKGLGDIYVTARPSLTQPFADPAPVTNVNSDNQEGRAWLTSDELTLALSTARDGQLDIEMIHRNPGEDFGSPNADHLGRVNASGNLHYDPFLSADHLRLYLAANSGLALRVQIVMATRASDTADFSSPVAVGGLNTGASTNWADPTLYLDERLVLVSISPPAGGIGSADLWYATRTSATGDFGAPVMIPGVNGMADDFDPVLGADGCELYFSSARAGRFHLYRAQITK
jgi:hypothetical protein